MTIKMVTLQQSLVDGGEISLNQIFTETFDDGNGGGVEDPGEVVYGDDVD